MVMVMGKMIVMIMRKGKGKLESKDGDITMVAIVLKNLRSNRDREDRISFPCQLGVGSGSS